MKKNILLIAKDFPPSSESSGVQRILKFSQYLPALNWDVQVLTMQVKAYGKAVSNDQMADIPDSVVVKRAFAVNTAMHLAVNGRYLSWMALPDRWMSWVPFAVLTGLRMISQQRPAILFSTYPCASAHLVGLILHRITGIKWVADFRDPMLYRNDNVKGLQARCYAWIERQTIKYCTRAIFTTPGAIEHYAKLRYSEYPDEKWVLIANGFDEQNFAQSVMGQTREPSDKQAVVLLHAGYLYRQERDPSAFFKGLALLFAQGLLKPGDIKIVLRASGFEAEYGEIIKACGLEGVVFLEPSIPYKKILAEMLAADGLLLFQGASCNQQIPAKIYEYFRAKKPVFALTDSEGDTASLLRDAGLHTMAPLDDPENIARNLGAFYQLLRSGSAPVPTDAFIASQSREARTQQLAALLDGILDAR